MHWRMKCEECGKEFPILCDNCKAVKQGLEIVTTVLIWLKSHQDKKYHAFFVKRNRLLRAQSLCNGAVFSKWEDASYILPDDMKCSQCLRRLKWAEKIERKLNERR